MSFYTDQKFYENINDVYEVTCPGYPRFKDRFTNTNVEIICNCLFLT